MNQLPEAYQTYLQGKDEAFVDTVKPILQQSAADQNFGVRIVVLPHGVQAHLDERIPFGKVVESVD
ncbi:hypothetical protein [Arthrobacter sp. GMC3]|uniref:hypothetical protein n=1 Tax=Arthrobacter sp. GMC3 TaxID=2058894 RepID=UPI000CE390C6|nr:hypothetical protein [Arthrobacter sp. GMC3]